MIHTAEDFYNLRITRKKQNKKHLKSIKRNILIFAITMAIVFIGGFMITTYAEANNNELVIYTVEPGDTLWTIAAEHMSKNKDIREYIYYIKKINDLHDSLIHPGQKIKIPIIK